MKNKHTVLVALFLCFTVFLSSCGKKVSSKEIYDKNLSATVRNESEIVSKSEINPESNNIYEPKYIPSSEEIKAYANTWKYIDKENEGKISRLILSEGGTAQLVYQDSIGQLQDLSEGKWSISSKERLKIDLILHMENGKFLEDYQQHSLGGEYFAVIDTIKATMTLSCEKNATPLVNNHENEALKFYDESCYPDEDPKYTEQMLCEVVLAWYEDTQGEKYPGVAAVDSISHDGWIIHLYEDMGDHIATLGWYTINPYTLIGTDDILGKEIDFSIYYN